jgi:hypothetical protein
MAPPRLVVRPTTVHSAQPAAQCLVPPSCRWELGHGVEGGGRSCCRLGAWARVVWIPAAGIPSCPARPQCLQLVRTLGNLVGMPGTTLAGCHGRQRPVRSKLQHRGAHEERSPLQRTHTRHSAMSDVVASLASRARCQGRRAHAAPITYSIPTRAPRPSARRCHGTHRARAPHRRERAMEVAAPLTATCRPP